MAVRRWSAGSYRRAEQPYQRYRDRTFDKIDSLYDPEYTARSYLSSFRGGLNPKYDDDPMENDPEYHDV